MQGSGSGSSAGFVALRGGGEAAEQVAAARREMAAASALLSIERERRVELEKARAAALKVCGGRGWAVFAGVLASHLLLAVSWYLLCELCCLNAECTQ